MNNVEKKKLNIENLIYEIRGKQVMLDSDLAKLYQCKIGTKTINLAVKRHLNRFPERFMFKLTDNESENIKFQVETKYGKLETRGGKYDNPFVFTEQGVAMLATILRTNIAVEVSIKIMDAFVSMRKYISSNLLEQKYISNMVLENRNMIIDNSDNIKLLQESFSKLGEKRKDNEIYFNGQIYDAYSKILDIFSESKKELIIIDSYADKVLLDIVRRLKINVILITKKDNLLSNQDIERYNKQYSNLKVIYNNTFHDRYFILDNKYVYHCGTSINRIGYKTFSINLISDEDIRDSLISHVKKVI